VWGGGGAYQVHAWYEGVNWIAAGHFRPLRMQGPDMFFILEKYLFNRIFNKILSQHDL
jgi:hypothetical protein